MNFAKPDKKRQKIVAVLLVVVGIILVWQLYELFTGDKTPQKATVDSMQSAPQAHQSAMAVTPAATAQQLAQNAASANDGSATVNPTNSQSEYLRLVNEYQMAQLQRMIAEDNEAIAIAKQNAAKATSETAKLMGTGSFTTASSSGTQSNSNDYQLVYTGQQSDGIWSATLQKNGQNVDVIVGGQLPDGSRVLSIDDNGVLLQQGNIKKLVTFSGVTQTTTQPGDNQAEAAMKTSQVNHNVASLPKLAQADSAVTTALPIKNLAPQHEAASDAKNSVLPVSVKEKAEQSEAALKATPDNPTEPDKKAQHEASKPKTVELDKNPVAKKPVAEKSTAALTATPDNPTAPAKTTVATTSKAIKHDAQETSKTAKEEKNKTPSTKPAAKSGDEKNNSVANIGEAVKIEKFKEHSIILESEKTPAKPVKYNSLLASNNHELNAAQPAVLSAIATPIADKAKNDKPLSPLQQPMVVFPHHLQENQPKNIDKGAIENAPVATPAVAKMSIPTAITGTVNSQILTVNPSYYTIQLTSDHKLENLQRFIKANNLQDKATYFTTYDMQNREIYILIYGQFSNSADAKAALEKLPQHAKVEGAFIVKYSTIQTVLKKSTPPKQ